MQQTNVLSYLEQTVTRLPDKVAYANETMGLTFGQVYHDSRAIGSRLHSLGAYNAPVVVFMEKHPKAIAAFFGCLYGGCYYVPIDEEMPRFRIEQILKNLDATVMICDEATLPVAQQLPFSGQRLVYDEMVQTPIDEAALTVIRERQLDTDPIYIVFTSGSTGVPKGVVACHRSVIDYIENLSQVLGFNEETRFANQSPLYFDACLKELYPTLKFGATTYLVPRKLFSFPMQLVEFLNKYQINTVCWVVSALTMISALGVLDSVKPAYLHTIAFGSEVFPVKQFRRWREALPNARFINLYGPTEATGMSCYYEVKRELSADESIPIGAPFRNTQILLLDDNNALAAPGEMGEICIKGTCLTMGYYHDFERTSQVFVQNPLNDRYPELIYRTGDLGKYNERGELLYIGRRDNQVKHMGHRIELGEIEAATNTLDGIGRACCLYDKEKGHILMFYTGKLSTKELQQALRQRLPRYMLPTFTKQLEQFPLTPNGKTDRMALKKLYEEHRKEAAK